MLTTEDLPLCGSAYGRARSTYQTDRHRQSKEVEMDSGNGAEEEEEEKALS